MIPVIRGLLAAVLLIGVYLLVATLFLINLGILAWGMWTIVTGRQVNIFLVFGLTCSALVIVPLLRAMIRLHRPTERADSLEITRERAPELWALVTELAERVGTRAPAELRLTADANAQVSEDSQLFGLVPGRRRLYLGAPLLIGLSTEELRAVVCHELGHYAGGHTRLGPMVYRGVVALSGARAALTRAMTGKWLALHVTLSFYLLGGYTWMYTRITLAARRQQEQDADTLAATVVGKHATASALRSAEALSAAWHDFHTRFLVPMRLCALIPDDPFSAFQIMINDPDYRDVLAEPRPPQPTSIWDSHPSLAHRLAALDRLPDTEHSRDPGPPRDLVSDRERLFQELGKQGLRPLLDPDPKPWRTWLASVAERDAADELRQLHIALKKVLRRRSDLTPEVVLDLLRSRQGASLAAALAPTRTITQRRELLGAAVFTLVGQALVHVGAASWTVPWTGVRRLVTQDTATDALLVTVVAAMDDPAEASRLRLDLAASQVDLAAPVVRPDATGTTDTSLPDKAWDLLEEKRSNRKRFFVIYRAIIGIAVLAAFVTAFRSCGHQPPAFPRPVLPSGLPGWPPNLPIPQVSSWPTNP